MARSAALNLLVLRGRAIAHRLGGEQHVAQRAAPMRMGHHAVHQQVPEMVGGAQPRQSRRPVERSRPFPHRLGYLDIVESEVDFDLYGIRAHALREVCRSIWTVRLEPLLIQ